MRLWLCVCLATLIQAQQNYYTTTESTNDVYSQTKEVEETAESGKETTTEQQELALIETTTKQEAKTTESAKEIQTTKEESTQPTATTVSTAEDLSVVEETDKTGKVVNKINGEVKMNGKQFVVKCKCDDTTTTPPNSETPTCPNHREYKITKLHSVLSWPNKRAPSIDEQDVRNMLPLPADIDFVPVRQTTLCDMDHRNQNAIMSGNGGDAVEFVIALQAFQYLCRAELDESTIEQFLVEYLKQIAPRQFFLRTSKDAVQHLNQELGRFVPLDGTPTAQEQAALLGEGCPVGKECGLMAAEGNGDVALKGMLNYPGKYFVNRTIVRNFIKAYFRHKWSNPTDTQLIVDGTKLEDEFRRQKAVVLLKTNAACHKEGTAPLLKLPLQRQGSATAGGIYVYQHSAVSMRREELAHFFAGHVAAIRHDLSRERAAGLMKLMSKSLGNRALEQTLRTVALGLPLFGVELVLGGNYSAPKRFKSNGQVTVESDASQFKQVDEVGVGDFLSE